MFSLFSFTLLFFGGTFLSLIASSFLAFNRNNFFSRFYYRLSVLSLGFLLYFLGAVIFYSFYVLFFSYSILVFQTLFLIATLISLYGFYNANHIRVKLIQITLENLPESWRGRKAVFFSDLHLGQVRGKSFMAKIVKIVKQIKPDIVLIGGDIYDGLKVDVDGAVSPFKEMSVPLGIYFVMGNHEEFFDNRLYAASLTNVGIKILNDEVVDIDGVQIVGVDYKTTANANDFKNVLNKISTDKSRPLILLKHVPLHMEIGEEKGISLQLSGHTHRAQVFPFSLVIPLIFKKFGYGLQTSGKMQVYTSSGVGTWGPPFRVGTNSEIIVFEFI